MPKTWENTIYIVGNASMQKSQVIFLQGFTNIVAKKDVYLLGNMAFKWMKGRFLPGNFFLEKEVYSPILLSIYQRLDTVVKEV